MSEWRIGVGMVDTVAERIKAHEWNRDLFARELLAARRELKARIADGRSLRSTQKEIRMCTNTLLQIEAWLKVLYAQPRDKELINGALE